MVAHAPITAAALRTKIVELAEANPTHIYEAIGGSDGPGCLYRNDPKCPGSGCIVGQALDALDPSWFRQSLNEMTSVEHVLRVLDVDTFETEERWFTAVQSHQDLGFTWGEALKHAKDSVG